MSKPSEKLNNLVGKWATKGSTSPDLGPIIKIKGTDTYINSPGGLILHTVKVKMGDDDMEASEMIGYDSKRKKYFSNAYDAAGQVTKYEIVVKGNKWSILGKKERSYFSINQDKTRMVVRWEKLAKRKWVPWMKLTLLKLAAR